MRALAPTFMRGVPFPPSSPCCPRADALQIYNRPSIPITRPAPPAAPPAAACHSPQANTASAAEPLGMPPPPHAGAAQGAVQRLRAGGAATPAGTSAAAAAAAALVTGTGFYGSERAAVRELARLAGVQYSGDLVQGRTTHLVLAPSADGGAASRKLQKAAEWGIPALRLQWLLDSVAAGALQPAGPYLIDFDEYEEQEPQAVPAGSRSAAMAQHPASCRELPARHRPSSVASNPLQPGAAQQAGGAVQEAAVAVSGGCASDCRPAAVGQQEPAQPGRVALAPVANRLADQLRCMSIAPEAQTAQQQQHPRHPQPSDSPPQQRSPSMSLGSPQRSLSLQGMLAADAPLASPAETGTRAGAAASDEHWAKQASPGGHWALGAARNRGWPRDVFTLMLPCFIILPSFPIHMLQTRVLEWSASRAGAPCRSPRLGTARSASSRARSTSSGSTRKARQVAGWRSRPLEGQHHPSPSPWRVRWAAAYQTKWPTAAPWQLLLLPLLRSTRWQAPPRQGAQQQAAAGCAAPAQPRLHPAPWQARRRRQAARVTRWPRCPHPPASETGATTTAAWEAAPLQMLCSQRTPVSCSLLLVLSSSC